MANLSQQKRERMLAFLKQLKEVHNDDESLISLNEIENELLAKKYGLVWEQHEENVDVMMRDNVPVFTEKSDREIKGINSCDGYNFILEGDNLHSLKLLEKTHRGKIDVIYIDPPYNTGNQFTYSDENIDLNDTFRHSKWLSFMKERLLIAHRLLSNNGIIFISIDDNEQANLKILCDEIFDERNFYTQIIVQSNKRGQTYKQIAKTHEYILVYTKTPDAEFNEIEKTAEDSDLNLVDNIGNYNIREIRNRNPKFGRFNRPNLYYAFYVNPNVVDKDGFNPVSLEPSEEYSIEVFPYNSKGEESCWRWGQKLSQENISAETQNSNVVAKIKRDGGYNIYEKYRKTTYKAKTIWDEVEMITEHGTVQLGELGLANDFQFPKPIELISKCLQIGSQRDSIILDFFAGSGTTGQAVLEMNKKDGGERRFILCTNNENSICEKVTYRRIQQVVSGYSDRDGIPANVKYYATDFIAKTSEKDNYSVSDELLKHIKEMIQLENGVNVDDENYLIILTDDDADTLESKPELVKKCKGIYISTDVFLTSSQEKLFADVVMKYIPNYYFEDELREVHEIW